MKSYLPENLDIDRLVQEHPPNIPRFKIDKLKRIISFIYERQAMFNETEDLLGFSRIHSTKLQKLVHDYRAYRDYLEANGVLEVDPFYKQGERSRGYKFTRQYDTKVKPAKVEDLSLIKKNRRELRKEKTQYPYLDQWFNTNLTIDYTGAIKQAEENYQYQLEHPEYKVKNGIVVAKDSIQAYNSTIVNIEKFREGNHGLCTDNTVGRYYSSITGIKSNIRDYIKYKGKDLIEIDLKTSQPYLSTTLFNPNHTPFYNTSIHHSSTNIPHPTTTPPTYILHSPPPMLVEFLKRNEQQKLIEIQQGDFEDVKKYNDLIKSGQFYEYLKGLIEDRLGYSFVDKKQLKQKLIFPLFFSSNRFIGQKNAAAKRLFKERFPTVYEAFRIIKRPNKSNLAVLLQRIESHLMLNVICKRIASERPEAPIYTIHDSILTIPEHVEYVQLVMSQELRQLLGIEPILSIKSGTSEKAHVS